ncbi:MAG TPA: choice-of-anchor tandem repeat GloVer-containing protein [Candidatus Cybelea sp.]|nr:choice-of-anchor tandem repeat GloVer-containing protein [Candidatus Cybelea sp.]
MYRFRGGADGSLPLAGLTVLGGALYGTTGFGGASNDGTVFEVSPSGSERVVYSFKGAATDGAFPQASLIVVNGLLYGTTSRGGASNDGTAFDVSESGTERVIYSFKGGADGWFPEANLTAVNGVLYGTTYFGGDGCASGGCGTFFKITKSGKEKVLYSFKGGADGAGPAAAVIAVNGTLYGTTLGGSTLNSTLCPDQGFPGCGTIYEVSASGNELVLRGFQGGTDGRTPSAGLVQTKNGLYGTTDYGGATGNGTVYKIRAPGSGYQLLHSFSGADGSVPQSALTGMGNALYGTTDYGGAYYGGVVFKISTSGKLRVRYNFRGGSDGSLPVGNLVALNGVLYGTTYSGGTGCASNSGCGTVFALTP